MVNDTVIRWIVESTRILQREVLKWKKGTIPYHSQIEIFNKFRELYRSLPLFSPSVGFDEVPLLNNYFQYHMILIHRAEKSILNVGREKA